MLLEFHCQRFLLIQHRERLGYLEQPVPSIQILVPLRIVYCCVVNDVESYDIHLIMCIQDDTYPPLAVTWSFILFISLSASVAQSIIDLPADTPARVPVSLSKTALLASGVDNILKMISQLSTTSFADDLITMFFSENFSFRST